ncbi:MAG: hypothetical protein GY909_06715 [Oligoflexia bacterium]|nr:hypothetical protein [Oligoflexia bacterium]
MSLLKVTFIFWLSLTVSVFASEKDDKVIDCDKMLSDSMSDLKKIEEFAKKGKEIAEAAEKMSDYLERGACNREGDAKNITAKFFHCNDGTISFEQPDSTGLGGWNGFCGETAASNILHMHCGLIASPKKYCNHYTNDLTPGTRPGSMKKGLNEMFEENESCPKGKWETYNQVESPEQYISYLVGGLEAQNAVTRTRADNSRIGRSPFPIMIEVPPKGSKGLHWVTVVDITGFDKDKELDEQDSCEVFINHWDDQYKVPCSRIAAWAKQAGCGAAGLVCGAYPRVKFVPEED